MVFFRDRRDAGDRLGRLLVQRGFPRNTPQDPTVVIALPRGGLPVAQEVCCHLNSPMDIVLSKKIGFPGQEEFAIGAVSARGARFLDEGVVRKYNIPSSYIAEMTRKLSQQCHDREVMFRGQGRVMDLQRKTVIIVDDGIATGNTMKSAIADVSLENPKRVIVATPVIARDTLKILEKNPLVAQVIYIDAPEHFGAVGRFYEDFSQTEDEEAKEIFDKFKNYGK